jgi:hypothetical protein
MSILTIIITLIVAGVLLWLINFIPMQATIKKIVNTVAVVFVVLWLLKVFGLFTYLTNIRV